MLNLLHVCTVHTSTYDFTTHDVSCTLHIHKHTIPILKDSRMVSPPRNTLCGFVEI